MITFKGGKTALHNRLWLARKCRGLGQKQVALLLNHKQIDQLSRFELGIRLPSLRHALALEIIYGVPVRSLFSGLYAELQQELRKRGGQPPLRPIVSELFELADTHISIDCCTCEELLRRPLLTQAERDRVRDHITRLAKQLASL